jgi:mono/diheme cytochrome c family protein
MSKQIFAALGLLALCAGSAYAMDVPGDPDAGRQLVMNSCTACHAPAGTKSATDGAPPLSFIARDTRSNPLSIHAWLMDPHPPMPGIMLSRQQVSDVIAYLSSLPAE